MTQRERELVEEVDLCDEDGRLSRDALGWSRRPLHRCNLRGRWGRKKRWDYWCVTTPDCMLSLTYADIDYLGLASAAFLDFTEQRWLERTVVVPLAIGFSQPATVGGADIVFERKELLLSIAEREDGTHLDARFTAPSGERVAARVVVGAPPGHETLGVVVPWSDRMFQYTSKHNTRPARGEVLADGRKRDIDGFGCLDYGRGIWPYRTHWNWASASGGSGDHRIGLQLGGRWTDGTGATENALCIDGRLSKINDDVVFTCDPRDYARPWRIATRGSDRVDLELVPFYKRELAGSFVAIGGELHLAFGRFSGTVVDDAGRHLRVENLIGWAEEVRARW